MLDAHYSHLYFCHSLYTLQRGLSAIAGLLVYVYRLMHIICTNAAKLQLSVLKHVYEV